MIDKPPTRRVLLWGARLAVPALLGLWLWRWADRDALLKAFDALPASALGVAVLLGFVNVGIGAFRWGLLMRAFDALQLPSRAELFRATLVCQFYNTFVPGSVAGDLVRALLMRPAFPQARTGLVLVVAERLLGLFALVLIACLGLLLGPSLFGAEVQTTVLAVALCGTLAVVALLAVRASGRLAALRAQIPAVPNLGPAILAFGISFVGHLVNVALYGQLAAAMSLPLGPTDILLVVPLALLASVVPLSLAGVGAREVALVALVMQLGVSQEQGTVLSLGFSAVIVVLGLCGGLVQWVYPSLLRYH